MIKYLLDTNIASYFADDFSPFHSAVVEKLSNLGNHESVYLSMLTIYEFQYGIACANSVLSEKFSNTQNTMTRIFDIMNLSEEGAEVFGEMKLKYRIETGISQKAIKQHNIDLMLASTAISENAVLVSNDRIFEQIQNIYPNLLLENWTI